MSEVVEHSAADGIIKQMKSEMADKYIWEAFRKWGETVENEMMTRAAAEWNYEFYDLDMIALPGTAKRDADGKWIVGYQFTITHTYLDKGDVELGKYTSVAYLVFNGAAKIAAILTEGLSEFTPTTKPD
jgi:hypothetical protein